MAHPPPPGTGSNNLPARPPASNSGFNRSGFKPAYSAQPSSQPPSHYGAPPSYGPSAPSQSTSSHYGPSYPSYGAPPSGPPAVSAAPSYSSYSQQPQQPQSYGPQSYGQPATSYASAAPQIRNPFPVGGAGPEYDPEMAAQIAQWQSAYVSKDSSGRPGDEASTRPSGDVNASIAAANANLHPDKKKTVAREGGGKKWTDDSLLEWDPSHLRLFVGNLAGETTDDSLLKAFSRWESVQKARVIRDKRTTKSKGYGFVSFSNADDFFSAAKEMNGKYIQSHPVVVRKANTEIKVTNAKDKDRRGKNKNNKKSGNGGGSGGNGGGNNGGYEAHMGAYGGGVTKPGQKTKNGLKLLG